MRFNEEPAPGQPPRDVPYVNAVKHYMLVKPVRAGQAPLRLACLRVYARQPGPLCAKASDVWEENYYVGVHSIDTKLVCVFPAGWATGNMQFIEYCNMSKIRPSG